MKVSAQYAEEHFGDLVAAVDNGEAVEIARPGKPALQLVRSAGIEAPKQRILGAGTALKYLPSEEELERIDREWKLAIEERIIGRPAE